MGILSQLSGPQASALYVLAGGGLKSEAAAAAGVHPQRVSEWLRHVHFREALSRTREDLVAQARTQLSALAAEAHATLCELIVRGPPSVRFRAAAYVLDRMMDGPTEMYVADAGGDEAEVQLAALLEALGGLK